MITYKTESGSIYDVEGLMVRRRVRSAISRSERVSGEWREAQSISYDGLGRPLVICWGFGPDEFSELAVKIGDIVPYSVTEQPGYTVLRHTVTTPVVTVVENGQEKN